MGPLSGDHAIRYALARPPSLGGGVQSHSRAVVALRAGQRAVRGNCTSVTDQHRGRDAERTDAPCSATDAQSGRGAERLSGRGRAVQDLRDQVRERSLVRSTASHISDQRRRLEEHQGGRRPPDRSNARPRSWTPRVERQIKSAADYFSPAEAQIRRHFFAEPRHWFSGQRRLIVATSSLGRQYGPALLYVGTNNDPLDARRGLPSGLPIGEGD